MAWGYADADGNLNGAQLSIGRPQLAEAMKSGLRYNMLHWQVPYIFPQLVDFAQSALNTMVSGDQGEIEILLACTSCHRQPCLRNSRSIGDRSRPVRAHRNRDARAGYLPYLHTSP